MNRSGISRRSFFARLFSGMALAAGATAANAHIAGIARQAPEPATPIASYTLDDEGRLLSVTYDGATPSTAAATAE